MTAFMFPSANRLFPLLSTALLLMVSAPAEAITVTTDALDYFGGAVSADGGDVSSVAALQASPGQNGIGLDEAMVAVNNTGGGDIDFAPGVVFVTLSESLPALTVTAQINGGGAVSLDFNNDGDGIRLLGGDGSVVEGLTILSSSGAGVFLGGTSTNAEVRDVTIVGCASHGIHIEGPGGHIIRRARLGTNGVADLANLGFGVLIDGSSNNRITTQNQIAFNRLGGVSINALTQDARGNVVGGSDVGGNQIFNNVGPGVIITAGAASADDNTVTFNALYENAGGTLVLSGGANGSILPPTLSPAVVAQAVETTAEAGQEIHYYAGNAVGDARFFLGVALFPTTETRTVALDLSDVDGLTITATATGASGNTSAFAESTGSVDGITPTVTITDAETTDTTPPLTGTVDDSSATIVVEIGANPYVATAVGATWTLADDVIAPLSIGLHDVLVTATDLSGNEGAASGSVCIFAESPEADCAEQPDAGLPLDAGDPRLDGGDPPLDAGSPDDAGARTDAGALSDAGALEDAGGQTDAGVTDDAGAQADAGVHVDAGGFVDAGVDAVPEVDAGANEDAGAEVDAGADEDAGGEVDGGGQEEGDGCRCVSSKPSLPGLAWIILGGLLWSHRRRRQRA